MLLPTKSFKVWGSAEEAKLNKQLLTKDRKCGNVAVGGRKITLEDVVKVSVNSYQVVLDPIVMQNYVELSSIMEKAAVFSPPESRGTPSSPLPQELCRAAVFYCISNLMQLKSGVRLEVAVFLTDALNAGIVPCFASVASAQLELLRFVLGQPVQCYTPNGIAPASDALRTARLHALESLYNYEGNTLLLGQFTQPGMAALVVAGAASTFRALDAVSSFSCESVEISASCFEADQFDVLRPQRGQMTSAGNLRLLLEASGNILSTDRTTALSGARYFQQIPQVNGPACELVSAAVRCVLFILYAIHYTIGMTIV